MKKTFIYLVALIALVFTACSNDDESQYDGYTYVTISGEWELHRDNMLGLDSVVLNPTRYVTMNWSDITRIDSLNETLISSQVTIGNGVWHFYSYILGNAEGLYTLAPNSYATYTYVAQQDWFSEDSTITKNYTLAGAANWEKGNSKFGIVTLDVQATSVDDGKVVYVKGPMKSALE